MLLAGARGRRLGAGSRGRSCTVRLDSTLATTIAPYGSTYYQISSSDGGDLSVMLGALRIPARGSRSSMGRATACPERRLRRRWAAPST